MTGTRAPGKVFYLCSNGRCGTQYIARQLSILAEDERVHHETMAVGMASRAVFRDPDERYRHIGKSPKIQRLLNQMEHVTQRLACRYISCSWPSYAYVDYFDERFGAAFEFLHLVRNPYTNAASHSTHHPMLPPRIDPMQRAAKIFGTDPNIKFRQFAKRYEAFTTFERQLLHWLEQTAFIQEQTSLQSYAGLFRFEDLFGDDLEAMNDVLSLIMGRPVAADGGEPFDRVHRSTITRAGYRIDPELEHEVDALARTLGYGQDALDAAKDGETLSETYARKRYDLPCDPKIPVVIKS